jgi:hypothetical protein
MLTNGVGKPSTSFSQIATAFNRRSLTYNLKAPAASVHLFPLNLECEFRRLNERD